MQQSKELSPILNLQNKLSFGVILLILSLTPLLFTSRMMYGFHVPKYMFFQLMVFLLLAIFLFRMKFQIRLNLLDLLIIFRPVYLMLLYFVSGNYSTVFQNIDILIYLTLFYLLLQQFLVKEDYKDNNRFLTIMITSLVIICFLESFYGILQYFHIDPFHPGGYQSYESNVIGTFGSENAIGGFLAAGIPLALYFTFIQDKRTIKYLIIAGIGMMLLTLALTISRGAWIALVVGLLFLGFPGIVRIGKSIFSNKILRIFLVVLLVLIAIVLLVGIYQINAESSIGRIFIWKISLGMVKDYPLLGVGYGDYGYQYLNFQAKFFSNPDNMIYMDKAVGLKEAHSEIIHVLAETGIIGLILFLSIFILFYYYADSILKNRFMDKRAQFMTRCIVTSVMVISMHLIVDNVLHVLPIALLFYFALAVISAKTKNEISTGKNIRRYFLEKPLVNFNLKGNIIFLVIGILLLILNGYFIVNKTIGYVHWKNGQDEVHIGRWGNGIYEYKRALNFLPDNGELQFHLGAAYSYIGEPEESIDLLTQSLEKFNDKNIYLTLGHAYRISGEYQKAEENFKTVIRMYPQLLLPHLWLAEMYYETDELDKSVLELRLIIDAKPKIISQDVIFIKQDAKMLLQTIQNLRINK